jgi:hypothetical protein
MRSFRPIPGSNVPAATRARRGLTLIETVCAATVLTVAVLGLSQVALTSNELRESGATKAAALRAVQQQVAQVQATDFAALLATWDGAAFDVLLDGATHAGLVPQANDADGRAGSVVVTAPTGQPGELLEVLVRVDWAGANGPQSVARRLRVSRIGSGS